MLVNQRNLVFIHRKTPAGPAVLAISNQIQLTVQTYITFRMPHTDNVCASQWRAYVQCINEGHSENDEDDFANANTVPTIGTNEFQQFYFIKACNLIVDLQVKTKWVQRKSEIQKKTSTRAHIHTRNALKCQNRLYEANSNHIIFDFFFRSLIRLSRVLRIWITTKYTQSFWAHVLHKTLSSENTLLEQKQFLGTCARACARARAHSMHTKSDGK